MASLAALRSSWELSLRVEDKAARTIETYLESFDHFAHAPDTPASARQVRPTHVRAWLLRQYEAGLSTATVSVRYRALRQFWSWALAEGEVARDPMAGVPAPDVKATPVAIIPDADLRRLLAACRGQGHDARRDTAIIRLLLDTGMRRAELVGLDVADLFLESRAVEVTGKGDRVRVVPFGAKTALALDRYLRVRGERAPDGDALFLGRRGRLGLTGVGQMLARRSAQAGIKRVHAHQFRHTFAHAWLAAGGSEGDLMRIAGWRTRDMLDRYGASAASDRAREAHARIAPGERV